MISLTILLCSVLSMTEEKYAARYRLISSFSRFSRNIITRDIRFIASMFVWARAWATNKDITRGMQSNVFFVASPSRCLTQKGMKIVFIKITCLSVYRCFAPWFPWLTHVLFSSLLLENDTSLFSNRWMDLVRWHLCSWIYPVFTFGPKVSATPTYVAAVQVK